MRTLVSCVFIGLFALSGFAYELLPDGGCEGTSGWADRQDSSATINYQQADAHGGSYCISFTGSFSERIESDPRSEIIPGGGESLVGSAWVKNTNGASRVAIYINFYNGTSFTTRTSEVNATNIDWTYLETWGTSDAAATHASLLMYGVSNGAPGKAFDDVSLGVTFSVNDWYLY